MWQETVFKYSEHGRLMSSICSCNGDSLQSISKGEKKKKKKKKKNVERWT